jgi:hypothetical protein
LADRLNTGGKQLLEFGDLLKVNAKALRLEMRRELEPVRTKLTEEMKARSKSRKIAATIKSGTRGTGNTVRVIFTAGAPGEPLARLYEKGNLGKPSASSGPTPYGTLFRHPVFPGDEPRHLWEWADQLGHPFMKPTVEAHRDDTPQAMRDAVEKTWRHSQPPDV